MIDENVFINYPLDDDYKTRLQTILFSLKYLEKIPVKYAF